MSTQEKTELQGTAFLLQFFMLAIQSNRLVVETCTLCECWAKENLQKGKYSSLFRFSNYLKRCHELSQTARKRPGKDESILCETLVEFKKAIEETI